MKIYFLSDLHRSIDSRLWGTRFLSNPLDYMDEDQKHLFDPERYIEL